MYTEYTTPEGEFYQLETTLESYDTNTSTAECYEIPDYTVTINIENFPPFLDRKDAERQIWRDYYEDLIEEYLETDSD